MVTTLRVLMTSRLVSAFERSCATVSNLPRAHGRARHFMLVVLTVGLVVGCGSKTRTNSVELLPGSVTTSRVSSTASDAPSTGTSKIARHAYVGVSLDPSSAGGARVATHLDARGHSSVQSGSPAARAGIKPGDVVIAINGRPISSADSFIATVEKYPPGHALNLTIKRRGQSIALKLTLGGR